MNNFKDIRHFIDNSKAISEAVYMVTSLIKDGEPIKWSLRNKALDLSFSDDVTTVNSFINLDRLIDIKDILASMLEGLSFSNKVGLLSEMNFSLLKEAIDKMVGEINLYFNANKPELIISPIQNHNVKQSFDFMPKDKVEEAISINKINKPEKIVAPVIKGQIKDNTIKTSKSSNSEERRNKIISLVKDKPNLTIKDFAEKIKGCSTKTIQRELLSLVEEGVLYKKGDRRWSTYSMVNM